MEFAMRSQNLFKLPNSIRFAVFVAGLIGLVTGTMAWFQVRRERHLDLEELERRAHAISHQWSMNEIEALSSSDPKLAAQLGSRLDGFRRLLGFAVYRPNGELIAAGRGVEEIEPSLRSTVQKTLDTQQDTSLVISPSGWTVHVLVTRLADAQDQTLGALATVHDVSYIEARATGRLIQFGYWVLIVTLLVATVVVAGMWLAFERPLYNLTDWMRRLRTENVPESPPAGLPLASLASESNQLAASFRAARFAGQRQSREVVREHNVWTPEQLRAHAIDCLAGGQLVVVSNREPYMHRLQGGKPHMIIPAGGLVTALDPVLQACGGLWVAHGAGDADRQTADEHGRLTVPPDDPRYTLRRVWLSREEEQGYYYGLSNEGIWPMCHQAHERPIFRASDWKCYETVNRRFADSVLSEIGDGDAIVLVQDYQLALVPQLLKAQRADIRVGIFWHIPWPTPEAFRICPWRSEILHGMLAADLIGFHLQQYCNNFLETVDSTVEARLDWDHFAVEVKGKNVRVRPFPISVENWTEKHVEQGSELDELIASFREQHKLHSDPIAVGVDRIDYTKGLPERFRAVERFLEKYPQHAGRFTLVQLGAPSRTHLRRYRELIAQLETLADEINWKHQTEDWKPIHFLVGHHNASTVHAFLKMASICIVSSLHDGMNLVAKEYVAAKDDDDGVLILSEFAGAARELSDALLINPYNTEQFAQAIHAALEMDPAERRSRMERMRRQVDEFNIYRWAATFLTALAETRTSGPAAEFSNGADRETHDLAAAT
jgi:trehalose 6-phosphate synthase